MSWITKNRGLYLRIIEIINQASRDVYEIQRLEIDKMEEQKEKWQTIFLPQNPEDGIMSLYFFPLKKVVIFFIDPENNTELCAEKAIKLCEESLKLVGEKINYQIISRRPENHENNTH